VTDLDRSGVLLTKELSCDFPGETGKYQEKSQVTINIASKEIPKKHFGIQVYNFTHIPACLV
jgi:hypothetical protein